MKNETWKYVLLMQSYGCFLPIPRNISDSSSSCMDKRPFFGQMAEKGPKNCPKSCMYYAKNMGSVCHVSGPDTQKL